MAAYKPKLKPNREKLLAERVAILNDNAGKLDRDAIGKLLGVSPGYVSTLACQHKISLRMPNVDRPKRKSTRKSKIDLDELKFRAGKISKKEIAEYFDVSPQYVGQFAHQHGISLALDENVKQKSDKRLKENKVRAPTASPEELEAASRLLRSNGYRVILPDPFMQLQHRKSAGAGRA